MPAKASLVEFSTPQSRLGDGREFQVCQRLQTPPDGRESLGQAAPSPASTATHLGTGRDRQQMAPHRQQVQHVDPQDGVYMGVGEGIQVQSKRRGQATRTSDRKVRVACWRPLSTAICRINSTCQFLANPRENDAKLHALGRSTVRCMVLGWHTSSAQGFRIVVHAQSAFNMLSIDPSGGF